MSHPVQLPLGIRLRDDATFDNFVGGDNGTLLAMLDPRRQEAGDQELLFYLYGNPGVGVSHLLEAACHQAQLSGQSSVYLPLAELDDYPATLLDGLENLDLVCIDDLQQVAGSAVWEEGLFHLFNRVRESGTRLLIGARQTPAKMGIQLPDLVSRLGWGLVFQVQPLDDERKCEALILRARNRGLELSEELARYILSRSARGMGALFNVLELLDNASLRDKRRLTLPFIKQVMGW
ncbi:DnaA regulatory inactivator Hda [Aestuariirhabdus litorea]|uniref:DnaA regulatory inactivator Hda n=1 Tax=Aestuariirhabdus litorea TaxID=2528527 RepID=A0A3P3VN17_9GAMM|nr:DnaA regulatory inactivator Hda [Aestuariirhabdus litorea]RRJ84151.1 DnaA regulatory inactivator Hda [Aestuariirhabdus litorea]RWW97371.1 DnaA regulatory inactivator Hda [Endozoicomonadaceae bacterium GTF-13]